MPLINQIQPTLIGGVSQQSPALRQLSECADAVNCHMSPVVGLSKRPPTRTVASFGTAPAVGKFHTIYRNDAEQYVVWFTPTGVEGINLVTGNPISVSDPAVIGYSYLSGMTDPEDFEVMTVSDTTFIVNKDKVVSMDILDKSAALPNRAYLFIRQGDYSSSYKVTLKLNGVVNGPYSVTTWKGTGGAPVGELGSVKTEDIMSSLASQISAISGVTATSVGALVEIVFDGTITTVDYVQTTDSVGDSVLSAIYDGVPRVEGWLPEVFRDGFKVEVVGDAEIDADNYWVVFQTDGNETGNIGKGKWVETVAPATVLSLNEAQMPHILANTGVDTFEWLRPEWGDRVCGDEDTNPDPTFVGLRMSNLFFYKNRLGFLAENQVCLSEVGEYFNFFRATMLGFRDTETIQVTTNHTKVTMFRNSAPFNENMILFSDRGQFILKGSEILSPRTVQILPVADFESNPVPNPEPTARSVFFAFQRGGQTGIRELFQTGDILTFDADNVTAKVPDYIPGRALELTASSLEDVLLVRTDESGGDLYVFKYLWGSNARAQTSWSRWTLPGTAVEILHTSFIENELYIVLERDGDLYIEVLTLATGTEDGDLVFEILLDRRITEDQFGSRSYNAATNETTITLPADYVLYDTDVPMVVDRDTGVTLLVNSYTSTTVVVEGDVVTDPLFLGIVYTMTYVFTEPLVRTRVGEGVMGDYSTPQMVRFVRLQYSKSVAFEVTTKIGYRAPRTSEFSSVVSDFPVDSLDAIVLENGAMTVPVRGSAKESIVTITNSTPYPSTFTSAQWEINYRSRARRVQ